MTRPQGFDRRFRVTKRREFLAVQRRGQTVSTPHFILLSAERPYAGLPRLGLTVSRKVGNAVARNHVKRRVREFFRRNRSQFLATRDYVCIARNGADALSQADVDRELRAAVRFR